MRIEKGKKRGRKKIETSSLQAIGFDIAAIREIKRRKKRIYQKGPKKKI